MHALPPSTRRLARRLTSAVALCVAAVVTLTVAVAAPAFAYPAKPLTMWSFYIHTSDTSTSYTRGCNQGSWDRANSISYSEVVLAFGVQKSDGSGNYLTGTGAFISTANLELVAENFALGYWACSGPSSTLFLDLGTNNDNVTYTAAMGTSWANIVSAVNSWIVIHCGQVVAQGANDMEPGFSANYTKTAAWANAYSSAHVGVYLNFGSADGCPQTTATGGACNNGWNQYDIWNVSWGIAAAVTAPEIYYNANGAQWAMIALYGNNTQGATTQYLGVWDENDLDASTLSPQGAWDALLSHMYANASTSVNPSYSMEIHSE